jgi:hypothetical protein
MNVYKFTSRLFYALVALWVVAVVVGGIFQLPYVARTIYGGVILPIYGGLVAGAMAACNLASGAIWRGRARRIERRQEPVAYWISIGVLASVSGMLLVVGIINWISLT